MSKNNESYAVASVKAFIIRKGTVLILRESPKYKAGSQHEKFVIPGGKVNEGEYFADSLKREVKEECGLEISVGQPFHIDEWRINVPNKPKHIVGIYICCPYLSGKVTLNSEFDLCEWIKPKKYDTYELNSAAKRAFASYLKLSPK